MALGVPIEELQTRISSQEFTDWNAYFQIEPHGYQIDEWRWGMLASSICNAVRSTIPLPKGARRPKVFKPSDFFLIHKAQNDLTPEQRQHIERKRKKKRGDSGRNS